MGEPTLLDAILKANAARVAGDLSARAALPPGATPFVITCMDPRLVGVVLPALGLEGVQVPQAKFAGGVVRPGDVSGTRSVLAAAIFNMATEVLVVGHTDCRMGKTSSMEIRNGLRRLAVPDSAFGGQDPVAWLGSFTSERSAVEASTKALREDPRLPPGIPVHGLMFRLEDRRIEVVVQGYGDVPVAAPALGPGSGAYVPGPAFLGAPPPPVFGAPGPPSALVPGPVPFGPPPSLGAPPAFAAPPPIAPPGTAPPPSFPAAPAMAVPQQPAPAEIHLGDEDPPRPDEPPPRPHGRKEKRKRPKGGDSPFDRAQEMLDRLRRE